MGAQRNRLKVYPNMATQRYSPKVYPNQRSTTLQGLLDSNSRDNSSRHAQSNSDHDETLSLVSYCSYIYTFTDPLESPSQRNLKHDKLIDLLSIIKSHKKFVPDEILSPLFAMISINLFRPLTPPTAACIFSILPDDDDRVATPAFTWPHTQIVYDILLRLILSLEQKALSEHIDRHFILALLALFQSQDPREREVLKNVFHKIYSKLLSSRSFMRKAMTDVLLHYVFDSFQHRHCGIGDLLEIWGTIINGLSVPLKEEHRIFLTRVLIPLHRPKGMQAFHKQLAYCVYQFVEKEPALEVVVVKGILRCWPRTNCPKEVLLIGELEELIQNMGPEQYKILALPLCTQITKCLSSWNSQVAERALYIWNNEQFVKMASEAIHDVFPIVVKGIENNLRCHWSRSVRELTENVKEMLEEVEPNLYSKCLSQIDSATNEVEMRRIESWKRIEMAAKRNQQSQSRFVSNSMVRR